MVRLSITRLPVTKGCQYNFATFLDKMTAASFNQFCFTQACFLIHILFYFQNKIKQYALICKTF